MTAPKSRKRRLEMLLEPVSGKALPVAKGETLRITQIEGGQCVDFNCFNLNDHKERMSIGHLRREGFHPRTGKFLWSNPPRFRPMMKILRICRPPALPTRYPRAARRSSSRINTNSTTIRTARTLWRRP